MMSVLHVQDKVFTNKGLKETTRIHVHVTQELKGGEVMLKSCNHGVACL